MQRCNTSRWLFFILLALAWPALAQPSYQGLLWQVEKGGHSSYLFGTIHSDDARVTRLPAPVLKALQQSKRVYTEMDMDVASMMVLSAAMILPEGESLSDHVPAELIGKVEAAMNERGIPPELTQRFQPWAVMVTLNMPEQDSGQFVDLVVIEQAKRADILHIGLETVQEQLELFEGMSRQEQLTMLEDTVKHLDELDEMFEQMLQAYLARDLDALMRISEESMTGLDPEMVQRFMQKILYDRNQRMVKRMMPGLRQESIFVAVGALHLPGEGGMIDLLRKQGYKVSPVY